MLDGINFYEEQLAAGHLAGLHFLVDKRGKVITHSGSEASTSATMPDDGAKEETTPSQPGNAGPIFTGEVPSVIDGGTVDVIGPNNTESRVRLSGINAPESWQYFGAESTAHLTGLILHKTAYRSAGTNSVVTCYEEAGGPRAKAWSAARRNHAGGQKAFVRSHEKALGGAQEETLLAKRGNGSLQRELLTSNRGHCQDLGALPSPKACSTSLSAECRDSQKVVGGTHYSPPSKLPARNFNSHFVRSSNQLDFAIPTSLQDR